MAVFDCFRVLLQSCSQFMSIMTNALTCLYRAWLWLYASFSFPKAKDPRPSDRPLFFYIRPDVSNRNQSFTCAHNTTKLKRCQNPIFANRISAHNVRRAILNCDPSDQILEQLMIAYVKRCSCHRHYKTTDIRFLASQWARQLKDYHEIHSRMWSAHAPYSLLAQVSQLKGSLTPLRQGSPTPDKNMLHRLSSESQLCETSVFHGPGAC